MSKKFSSNSTKATQIRTGKNVRLDDFFGFIGLMTFNVKERISDYKLIVQYKEWTHWGKIL